jgi:hypothetical protein
MRDDVAKKKTVIDFFFNCLHGWLLMCLPQYVKVSWPLSNYAREIISCELPPFWKLWIFHDNFDFPLKKNFDAISVLFFLKQFLKYT